MRLKKLLEYDTIVVQCHDNPDADAIASGFGLFKYFQSNNKNVRLVYGGRYRIQKSNLILMVSELQIPIEYVDSLEKPDLLITVDCQYGEGNVKKFEADHIAVIDHHQISGALPEYNDVRSSIGACSTVVKELLEQEGFDINEDVKLATALYYGLMTDTNNFTEIFHPLDKDLRDDTRFERSYITKFRNSNISLQELVIAGNALLGYEYNEEHRFAVIMAKPCDPNVLGIISDMMLEVDAVDTCLVYSPLDFGVKISVRSCIKEVNAGELAEYITERIGSGGGHGEKAGGFIQKELLDNVIGNQSLNAFLTARMLAYFENVEIIETQKYEFDASKREIYIKKKIPCGYIVATDIFPEKTEIIIRSSFGDIEIMIEKDTVIMIGTEGEIYPVIMDKVKRGYELLDEPYEFKGEYKPVVKRSVDGTSVPIVPLAKKCIPSGEIFIYTKVLEHRVKVFNQWDEDKYMLGNVGDILAVRSDDFHDVYIIKRDVFDSSYYKR